jgi:cell division protein FtsW (lipid II flippase)
MLRQRGGRPDYALLTVVGILIPIGLPMVYSASLVDAITLHDNHLYYVWRQVGAAIAGIIGMLVLLRIDLQWLRSQSARFMALAIVLLIAPLALPETMTTVNDARSWIRIGGFSFQPSELAKFALILFIADWLSRRGERVSDPLYGLLPFTGIMAVVCGLVLLGRDLGTTIVIAVIGAVMYFVAGASILHIIGAVVIAAGAFWSMIALVVRYPGAQQWCRIPATACALRARQRGLVRRRHRPVTAEVRVAATGAHRCDLCDHRRRARRHRHHQRAGTLRHLRRPRPAHRRPCARLIQYARRRRADGMDRVPGAHQHCRRHIVDPIHRSDASIPELRRNIVDGLVVRGRDVAQHLATCRRSCGGACR